MIHSTSVLEIDRGALCNNLKFMKGLFGPGVKISSVVKANAYGHGAELFVPMAESMGVDHFSVFSADEAYRILPLLKQKTALMVMGWMDHEEMEWAIANEVEFWIFEPSRLSRALSIARRLNKPARIHLEAETGMNRTGLKTKEIKQAALAIRENSESLILNGLCTHFAGAESIANHYRVQNQIKRFNRIKRWFLVNDIIPHYLHTASSAAALTYPNTRMNLVRIGIAQYGFWPSDEAFIHYVHHRKDKTDPLNRILTWKSKIMSIKSVEQGEFVSYGTTYLAQEDKKIAIIPVGYSHGFSRSLSNQGRVLINGQRVGVIGMVNMNMLIADVSSLPDVKLGDEVVIIGNQGELEITVASFSEISNQVNYELLARLPSNIKRIIKNYDYGLCKII
jgi:alanine racemase